MKYLRFLQAKFVRVLEQYQTGSEVCSKFSLPTEKARYLSPHQRVFVSSYPKWCNLTLTRFYTSRNTKPDSEVPDSKARTHFERRLVPFKREHLFEVVKNVDEYKFFVPWCEDSRVLYKKDNEMEAELTVGFKILSERYVSHILLEPPCSIRVKSPETRLFEYLINEWYFKPGPDAQSTWLEFYVSFKFRSFLYQHIVDMFFEDVVKRMVTAFENRAKHVEVERRTKQLEERVPWTK
ncbi:hypothetical protein GpartN1_g3099.t1 [Galdieria partita]|uniref:Coenzyme Q-binding protein COQ10 START domain-containing protein n=1 Tax=Galdieria partita TaxID=83374 RepID=A0A9C7PUX3_9RHOD|nr:hypothetical protein GpartN1_g3099.t1 [Galdieria partita]